MCNKFPRVILSLTTAFLIAGCGANHHSVFRNYQATGQSNGDTNISLIDAKQRAILAQRNGDGGRTMVCSEPSPDALSVLASSFGASGSFGDATTEVGAAFSAYTNESGAAFGLRTQTITALRDLMFYMCQYYMSDAIGTDDMRAAILRQGKLLTAILAIEQLTGATQPSPVQISAKGGTVVVSPTLPGTASSKTEDDDEADGQGADGAANGGKDEDGKEGDEKPPADGGTPDTKETLFEFRDHNIGTEKLIYASASTASLSDASYWPVKDEAAPKKGKKEDGAAAKKDGDGKKDDKNEGKKEDPDTPVDKPQNGNLQPKEAKCCEAQKAAVAGVVDIVRMVQSDNGVVNLCLTKLLDEADTLDEFTKEVCRAHLLLDTMNNAKALGVEFPKEEVSQKLKSFLGLQQQK